MPASELPQTAKPPGSALLQQLLQPQLPSTTVAAATTTTTTITRRNTCSIFPSSFFVRSIAAAAAAAETLLVFCYVKLFILPVPVAARSNASVCGRSLAGVAGSNLTGEGSWVSVRCECCVSSGRGLCHEPITRLEKSYRLWCVAVCDLES